jgi:transcription antitermination factor NusG
MRGDRVKITAGPFENFVAIVDEVLTSGRVRLQINVFDVITPVEVELTQLKLV